MSGTVRPAGQYESAVLFHDHVFVAGMTPKVDDVLVATGRVGDEVGAHRARELAGIAAARAIAAIEEKVDTRGKRVIPLSLTVFVNSVPEFVDLSAVADGASLIIAEWAGGRVPARATIGVQGLPAGAPVEVSLVVGLEPEGSSG